MMNTVVKDLVLILCGAFGWFSWAMRRAWCLAITSMCMYNANMQINPTVAMLTKIYSITPSVKSQVLDVV